jgi:hypothetical protein
MPLLLFLKQMKSTHCIFAPFSCVYIGKFYAYPMYHPIIYWRIL